MDGGTRTGRSSREEEERRDKRVNTGEIDKFKWLLRGSVEI